MAAVLLDLVRHSGYLAYYQGLHPGHLGTPARLALFRGLWASGEGLQPGTWARVRQNIVPTVTTGTHRNPTRAQLLAAIGRVRRNQVNATNQLEVDLAVLLASRPDRWAELARHVGQPVPTHLRLYRFVHDRPRFPFVRDVADQWQRGDAPLGVLHYPESAWSMLESGALTLRGAGANGVLYVADVPFPDTFMDILVDDSTFVTSWWPQAEVLAVTDTGNVLTADETLTRVLFRGRWYAQPQWASLCGALSQAGFPV